MWKNWILVAIIAIVASSITACKNNSANTSTAVPRIDSTSEQMSETELEVGAWVADEIIRESKMLASKGHKSPEGDILIQINPSNTTHANECPPAWLDVPYSAKWKYLNGSLILATNDDIEKVKTQKEANLWIIAVQEISNNMALVDVAEVYRKSSTPGFSGGGNGSTWRLRFNDGNWQVESRDAVCFWD